MDSTITIQSLVQIGAIIMGLWAFYKVIKEIVKNITDRHDREQKWDEMSKEMTENIQAERDKIYDKYDKSLEEIRKEIEAHHCQEEAKMQELNASIILLTRSVKAILEGQIEQGCDGPVKEAKKELDEFLMSRI